MYTELEATIKSLTRAFDNIRPERKALLRQLTVCIKEGSAANAPVLLNYICTHNSRRSHIAQVWSFTASLYYGIKNVESFSGGTEETAVNFNVIQSLRDAGFHIEDPAASSNPEYKVSTHDDEFIKIFSKKFDHDTNPSTNFAAIMVCSDADKGCPIIRGSLVRIAIPYSDPKKFDETPYEKGEYQRSVAEIGTEILYAFSQVSPLIT